MCKRQENLKGRSFDHTITTVYRSRSLTIFYLLQSRVYLIRQWLLRRLSTALFAWNLSGPDSRVYSVMAVIVGVIGSAIQVYRKKCTEQQSEQQSAMEPTLSGAASRCGEHHGADGGVPSRARESRMMSSTPIRTPTLRNSLFRTQPLQSSRPVLPSRTKLSSRVKTRPPKADRQPRLLLQHPKTERTSHRLAVFCTSKNQPMSGHS